MDSDGYFGAREAAHYDADSPEMFAPGVVGPAVDALAALAGDGRALELAIGTGRIGLPLAARGVEVVGIELSQAMVAQMRAKPGGEAIAVTIGDMASTTVAGEFALVYLVFNTLVNLTSQDAQVACFANAAAHLRPGGHFVVEVGFPQLQRVPAGERHHVFSAEAEHWGIDEYDPVEQGLISHHIRPTQHGPRAISVPFRYVWPAELDLMARLAGLELVSRAGGWSGEPFTNDSTGHVSTWRKP